MTQQQREIICLGCPNGCALDARWTGKDDVTVEGATCERGEEYARSEIFEPKRTVTAVVRTTSHEHPCVPVKTATPLLRPLIPRLLEELYRLRVDLPVQTGAPLIEDYAGTGVSVVFTRTVA